MPASVEEQPEIFQLISSGNLDGLKELVKQNPHAAKIRYTNGVTALLWAAFKGHLLTVQWLLAEGWASITEQGTDGTTALLCAASGGHLPIVQWLLAKGGASITERDTHGDTPLLWAAYRGHLSTVQWLLAEGGASITEKNIKGQTALLWAAKNGHLPTVQWLLAEGGASITEQNTQADTALLWAAFKGHLHIVQWLLTCANANIHETNKVLRNALAEAMRNKTEETALFLYHYGRPHNASIHCLSQEKVIEFDRLKQIETGLVKAVAKDCGFLPWELIKIINSYAFICLSESEGGRLYHYDAVAQQFEVSRTRLSPETTSLFPRFFEKLTLVPADAIPAEADISAMKTNLFHLNFLIDYTKNPNVPLESNPINLLVQEEIKALQDRNKDLTQPNSEVKQSNADTQQNYIFILKTLRAFLLLGAVAGIVTLIAASTLLTRGALTAVVITGGVIGAASTFAFFQTHKAINRQQTALPIQVEETPVFL